MSANDFDYVWDYNLHNGMGGWRFEPKEEEPNPARTADEFRDALIKKMS